LAVHAYHDSDGYFPVNSLIQDRQDNWNAPNWSWLARILPYVEMGNLYDQGNIPRNNLGQSLDVVAMQVKLFLCPSDGSSASGPRTDRANLVGRPVGLTNYKGVSGANWGLWSSAEQVPPNDTGGSALGAEARWI